MSAKNSSNVSDVSAPSGNSKQKARRKFRRYFICQNHFTQEEIDVSRFLCSEKNRVGFLGLHIGEKSGIPHFHFYMESKTQIDFDYVQKRLPKSHVEEARGSAEQCYKYCNKENKIVFDTRPPKVPSREEQIMLYEYNGDKVAWKQWQQDVIEMIEKDSQNKRQITWYWEPKGNVGKSYLCKYLSIKYDAIIASGKKNDVLNQIKNWLDTHPNKHPKVIILDVPRGSYDYVNYPCIEEIRGGCIYSGKFEGGVCRYLKPTMVVFANEQPEYNQWSVDRYDTIEIK